MTMTYYAKSPDKDGTQETVQAHLKAVKALAGEYGRAWGEEKTAELCGLFHDFGKYSLAFQNVLKGTEIGIDHAICGAAFLFFYQTGFLFDFYLLLMFSIPFFRKTPDACCQRFLLFSSHRRSIQDFRITSSGSIRRSTLDSSGGIP